MPADSHPTDPVTSQFLLELLPARMFLGVHERTAKVEDDHLRIPSAAARKARVDNARGAVPWPHHPAGLQECTGRSPRARPTHGRRRAPPAVIRTDPKKRKNLLLLYRLEQNGAHLVSAPEARRALRIGQ